METEILSALFPALSPVPRIIHGKVLKTYVLNVAHGCGRIFQCHQAGWHKAQFMHVSIQDTSNILKRHFKRICSHRDTRIWHIVSQLCMVITWESMWGFSCCCPLMKVPPWLAVHGSLRAPGWVWCGWWSSCMSVQLSSPCSYGDAAETQLEIK